MTRLRNSCLIVHFLWKKYGSSRRRCSVRKSVLKNFANFTGKQLCWSLFLWNGRSPACKFFEKRLQHKCFPVKFVKLLKTSILKNICKRLLLEVSSKKAVLKHIAIFTGRKELRVWVIWKRRSWWLIELWKWHVFILINISCKNSWLNELSFP